MNNYGNRRNVQGYRRVGLDQWVHDGGRFDGNPAPDDVAGLLEESYRKCEFDSAFQVTTRTGEEFVFVPKEKADGGGWHRLDSKSLANALPVARLTHWHGKLADEYLDTALRGQRPRTAAHESYPAPLFAPDMS